MIGVTGASGRLGQAILNAHPEAIPIGRKLPADGIDIIIHAATARGRTQQDTDDFHAFNLLLADYCATHRPIIVNVGSCWQILTGTCSQQPYTAMKNAQEALFPTARHVIPYWIYGPQKGFIHQLKEHLNGSGPPLTHAGTEPRDFIHVTDVARACLTAIALPPGRYAAASMESIVPNDLAAQYGLSIPIREDPTTAALAYPLPMIGRPTITVDQYLTGRDQAADPIEAAQTGCRIHSQAIHRTASRYPTGGRAG